MNYLKFKNEGNTPQENCKGTEGEIPKGGWRGTEGEIPKGGWRASSPTFRDMYRSTTGEVFEFAFYLVNGLYYEIDILSMPSYQGRPDDFHTTHRLGSNHGNQTRICIGDETSVVSFQDAKHWAAKWSEHTIQYISNGTSFPK